jgi:hypothetical protein
MNTIARYLSSAILAVASTGAHAANGWTEPLKIVSAFVEDSDYLIVYTEGGRQYVKDCSVNNWNIIASGEARKSRIWATVLAAAATGQRISFWYSDAGCSVWGYHGATAVRIFPQQ